MASQPTIDPSSTSTSPSTLFSTLESYPWSTDPEFQSGLLAILGSNPRPSQATELTLRARCFYYARKAGVTVDFDEYKSWRRAQNLPDPPVPETNGDTASVIGSILPDTPPRARPVRGAEASRTLSNAAEDTATSASNQSQATETQSSGGAQPDAPYPTSFQHIVELITTGQPIPGIKEIPPTILEGQGTESVKERRRKPWEKARDEGKTEAGLPERMGSAAWQAS